MRASIALGLPQCFVCPSHRLPSLWPLGPAGSWLGLLLLTLACGRPVGLPRWSATCLGFSFLVTLGCGWLCPRVVGPSRHPSLPRGRRVQGLRPSGALALARLRTIQSSLPPCLPCEAAGFLAQRPPGAGGCRLPPVLFAWKWQWWLAWNYSIGSLAVLFPSAMRIP